MKTGPRDVKTIGMGVQAAIVLMEKDDWAQEIMTKVLTAELVHLLSYGVTSGIMQGIEHVQGAVDEARDRAIAAICGEA